MKSVINLLILLAFFAGIVILQCSLSKKASRWPGLILPIITFAASFLFVINVQQTGDLFAAIRTLALAFLIGNIPTAVLLVIYALIRKKRFIA